MRKFLNTIKYAQNPVPRNSSAAARKIHVKQNNESIYQTLRFLFDGTVEFDAELLNEFENLTRPMNNNSNGLFDNLKHDWFKLLPVFFRIQRFNHDQNLTNFVIVPQTSFQRRHILIDTNALHALHAQLDIVPMRTKKKKMLREDFTKKPQKIWPTILNLDNPIRKEKFNYSILTDGVAVTLICEKIIKKTTEEEHLKNCQKNFSDGRYKYVLGLDPGYR